MQYFNNFQNNNIETMSKQKQGMTSPLVDNTDELKLTPEPSKNVAAEANIDWHDFQYKQFGAQPQIRLTGVSLLIVVPILIVLHIQVANGFSIPILQYMFGTMLTSFIINYTAIIRKYQLMPYLPVQAFDNRLKLMCVLSVASCLASMKFGWNGSGGIIFAIFWEQTKGSKMGVYGYFFLMIIAGELLMQKNYSMMKFIEFIPGLIFGYVNSELYKLKSSSTYAITHQFVFLSSIALPVFFPAAKLIVPSFIQWLVMIICGLLMLVTVVLTVKLMQSARVSVVMGVLSGILMIGTTVAFGTLQIIGLTLITVGMILLIKKEYEVSEY